MGTAALIQVGMWNLADNRVNIALFVSLLYYVGALLMYHTNIEDNTRRPSISKSEWKRWQINIVKHLNYSVPNEPVDGFRDNMKRGKCKKTRYITVQDIGQLGNQMNEYASLLSHSKRLGMTPFIARHMKEKLSAIFG